MCKLSKLPGEKHGQPGRKYAPIAVFRPLQRETSRLGEPPDASGAEKLEKTQQALDTGGARDVKMGSEIRLSGSRLNLVQPKWEIPV